MKMNKYNLLAVAVSTALFSGGALAENSVTDNWTLNGYGHLMYNVGESQNKASNYEHRRDYRAAGPAFSANPNQVEFTATKADKFDGGMWANYVIKTEYGNNEGGDGEVFYYSSGGNEGHNQTGELEFKEAYIELGNLSFLPSQFSMWTGRRYVNRALGIITIEYWKQSSGVGGGVKYKNMGFNVVSADPGDGIDGKTSEVVGKDHTTMTSVEAYLYSVKFLGGSFDFDAKYLLRANMDDAGKAADKGLGLGITYKRDFYGFDGWSTTAVTYGKGIAATKGLNFGNWNGDWNEEDQSIFATTYGVLNLTDNIQVGHELVYWNLENQDNDKIWGQDEVTRIFYGIRPSFKVNENFRLETTLTYAIEDLASGAGWGRVEDKATFFTATIAPVFTVNSDYWGRPQIKPYVTYMTSNEDTYTWNSTDDAKGDDEVRFGVEGEIWF